MYSQKIKVRPSTRIPSVPARPVGSAVGLTKRPGRDKDKPMLATRPDSPGHLLWLVRTGRAHTRSDLQRVTGLSRSTVVQRLDLLLVAGLIRVSGAAASTGGRPAQRLVFNSGHGVLLAAEIGADRTRAAVLDVGGQVLADEWTDLGLSGTQPVPGWLTQSFDRLLSATGWKPDQVRGIAVGLPSPKGGNDVAQSLAAAWECPVLAERAADLIALGENVMHGRDGGALLLLQVGATVDAGLIVGGAIHQGAGGAVGDLGHIRLPALAAVRCACGAYGCLAAEVSTRALATRLTALGVSTKPGPQLAERVRAGHPAAVRVTRSAGWLLGQALAPAVHLIDPDVVVLTGDVVGESMLAGLDEALHVSGLTRRVPIRAGTAGVHALAAGAHRLLVERVYAPAAIDAHLLPDLARPSAFPE
jgi:predicted NBD/HSP70 family sugar kinase